MIGVRDIKEEVEVEEGEVHLEEELLPWKQIKEEQSRIIWMQNMQQGLEEGQHLQLYEQQQQGAEQQQQFSQIQELKEGQQEEPKPQQQQQQQIQKLKEQQRQQQHRQRQEQQEHEHQHKKLQQQQQQVEQHQQQQQQHLLEQQQWEAWQQERDPLEIEQPLGGEEVHLMPNLLTFKPGVMYQGSGRMTAKDDDVMNALDPSREKKREMEKQYRILLPLYEGTLRSSVFSAAARRSSALPSNTVSEFMMETTKEQRQLRKAVKKEWKEELLKKTETTLRDLEQQLKALQPDDKEEEEAGGGVGSIRKALVEKMTSTMTELHGIKETKVNKVPLPPRDTPLDWERISAQVFDGTWSAIECQLMWNHLLHPSINRKAFSKAEDQAIQRLVKCKGTDYDAIAKSLCNHRTWFLVMRRWVSFLKPMFTKWDNKDTKKLQDAVSLLQKKKNHNIPWSQVHQYLPGYTKSQLAYQWSMVNPNRHFLRLRQEEYSVFVKATYLFGLDFSNMAYFLTRLSCAQVINKFKRSMLYPLLHKPWTREEDKILLMKEEPSQGSSRKSKWHLPCRPPYHSKCRYFTLKLWQEVQKEDEETPPPPFFPLANTTDPCKIENLRKLLMVKTLQDETLKEAVEDCRKDIQMHLFLEDLVAFRSSQKLITCNSVRDHVRKPSLLRGRYIGCKKAAGAFNIECKKAAGAFDIGCKKAAGAVSILTSLLDRFLESGRCCGLSGNIKGDNSIKSLKVLSEFMLFKPRPTDEEEEEEEAGKREAEAEERATRERKQANGSYKVIESGATHKKKKTHMSHDDSVLWELLVEKQEEEAEQQRVMGQDEGNTGSSSVGSAEGGGGSGGMSEVSDAVDSVFDIPYIPPNEITVGAWSSISIHVSVLTEMARGNFFFQNYVAEQLDTMTEAQLTALLREQYDSKLNSKQGLSVQKKKALRNDICSPDFNTYSRLPRKRKINLESPSSQQDSWTLPAVFSTSTTLPKQDSAPAAATTMPSTSMGGSNEESTHQILTRDKADELLFHRMLSLFHWPVVMMQEKPEEWQIYETEQRMISSMRSRQKEENPRSKKDDTRGKCDGGDYYKARRRRKQCLKWSYYSEKEMEMEKMTKEIEDLEKKMRDSQAKLQEIRERRDRQRGMKRKRPEEPELNTAQPQGPKQPEMQSAPVQDKEVEMVDEGSQSSTPSQHPNMKRLVINMQKSKQKLTALKKSLNMKELWEKRRQGVAAPRKNSRLSRGSREYIPRETSTRRRKREEESNDGNS